MFTTLQGPRVLRMKVELLRHNFPAPSPLGLDRKQGPGFPAPRGPAARPSHSHVTACVTHERLTVQNAWAAGDDGRAHPGCRVRGGEGPGSPRSRSRLSAAAATGLYGPRGRSARRGGSSRASCDSPSWDPPLHSGTTLRRSLVRDLPSCSWELRVGAPTGEAKMTATRRTPEVPP